MATAACTNDYSYDSIAAESGQEVYFPSTNAANVSLVMGEGMQTFEIPVTRVKTESAATVNITSKVAQHSSLFSIPSSVSFAAGQSETKIPVSYNAAELGYENPDTLSFTISDETAVTPYGAKEYTCTVLIPAPLKLLGTGSFTDNFWFEESNDVKIYQNTLNPNEFRIMDPFNMCAKYSACTGNQSEYVTVTLLKPGQTAFGVDITMPELILVIITQPTARKSGAITPLHLPVCAHSLLGHTTKWLSIRKMVCLDVSSWLPTTIWTV